MVNKDGSYCVTVGGSCFLNSSATFFSAQGQTFSTANGSLKMDGEMQSSDGSDANGYYTQMSFDWKAGAASVTTKFRVYDNFVNFIQVFNNGVEGATENFGTVSAFPAFKIEGDPNNATHGYVSFMVSTNMTSLLAVNFSEKG